MATYCGRPQWAYILPCTDRLVYEYLVATGQVKKNIDLPNNIENFLVKIGRKHGLANVEFEMRDCFDWEIFEPGTGYSKAYFGIVLYRNKPPESQEDIKKVEGAIAELKSTLGLDESVKPKWCLIDYEDVFDEYATHLPQLSERPEVFT